jgi:hypothetical protein
MPLLYPDIVVESQDYRKVGCGTKMRPPAAHIGSYVARHSPQHVVGPNRSRKLKVTGPCAS